MLLGLRAKCFTVCMNQYFYIVRLSDFNGWSSVGEAPPKLQSAVLLRLVLIQIHRVKINIVNVTFFLCH